MEEINLKYILITPAKNEADNLPALVNSVIAQNVKPMAWFIVDDNSDDLTPKIIEESIAKYPWIHAICIKEKHKYDLGEHYSEVCIKGFEFGIEYCKWNGIQFDYIALSDADMTYPF